MLECKDVRPLLAEYEAGNLPEVQAQQVADHLLLCPICAAALEDLRRAGDRPVITAEAPSPAVPRSLGTQDPLAEQKAAPAEEVPAEAEEQAITDGQITEIPPARKLRLRTKMLLAAGVVLLALVGLLVLLWRQEVFSIAARAKAPQGEITGVVYKGYKSGEKDGFRVRLRDGAKKEWVGEVLFRDCAYEQAVWSPDGRWLAVEYTDAAGAGSVYVMDAQRERQGYLSMALLYYVSQVNITPAVAQGNLSVGILQWLPDSSALLISGEIPVGESDPDYGVMPLENETSGTQSIATGYFVYRPDTEMIESHSGFLREEDYQRRESIARRLYNWREVLDYQNTRFITYAYGLDALKTLVLCNNGGYLKVLRYLGDDYDDRVCFSEEEDGAQAIADLKHPEELMLMVNWEPGKVGEVIRHAYLVLSWYEGGAK